MNPDFQKPEASGPTGNDLVKIALVILNIISALVFIYQNIRYGHASHFVSVNCFVIGISALAFIIVSKKNKP